jgi:hypothetical protein
MMLMKVEFHLILFSVIFFILGYFVSMCFFHLLTIFVCQSIQEGALSIFHAVLSMMMFLEYDNHCI